MSRRRTTELRSITAEVAQAKRVMVRISARYTREDRPYYVRVSKVVARKIARYAEKESRPAIYWEGRTLYLLPKSDIHVGEPDAA